MRVDRGPTAMTGADPGPLRYRFAHATDRGRVREQNEDAIAIAEECGLALVADGMGGYNAGEVASGLAAEFLVTHLVDDLRELREGASGDGTPLRVLHALLRARIDGVNDAIIDAAAHQPAFRGMGTTLAMLLFTSDVVITLHLGDSRIYRLRDDVLSLLTRDHSLLQEQLDAGVLTPGEARDSINRNFVTRALGVDTVAEPEINEYDLMAGDLYLICSDGLPDMLDDEEIFDLLRGLPIDTHDRAGAGMATGGSDEQFDGDEPESDGVADGRGVAVAPVADRRDDGVADDAAGVGADPGGGEPPVEARRGEATSLADTAAKLVEAANARGGRDNVSVVLASVGWTLPAEATGVQERGAPPASLSDPSRDFSTHGDAVVSHATRST